MTESARGTIADRPWGLTFANLGRDRLSGQLTVVTSGRSVRVAFDRGAVVGASSPLASDAAVRVARMSQLISSTQVAEISRRQQAEPLRDEIELIAGLARLSPDQVNGLREQVVAQRAIRTFSIECGDFTIDDRIDIEVAPGARLDVRSLVYLGARRNLSEQRLSTELASLGSWFRIKTDAILDLPLFGFGDAVCVPVIEWIVDNYLTPAASELLRGRVLS